MFWNNFVSLCTKHNTTPNAVCSELKLSNAAATHWKNGSVPRDTTLKKIADFFNVSTDSLLGKEEKTHDVPNHNYALYHGGSEITEESQNDTDACANLAKKELTSKTKKKKGILIERRPDFYGDEEFRKKHSVNRDEALKYALFGYNADDVTPKMLNDVREYADFIRSRDKTKDDQ